MQQRQASPSRLTRDTPWSPYSVALITLFLPPGGVVLTVRNLVRLDVLTDEAGRQLTIALMIAIAVGYSIVVGLSHPGSVDLQHLDTSNGLIIDLGLPFVSIIAQLKPYSLWRAAHPRVRTSSWLQGLKIAVIGYFLTFIIAIIVVMVFVLIAGM